MTEGQSASELLDQLLSEIDDASSPEAELEESAFFHARCELITLRQQVVINPKANIHEGVEAIRARVFQNSPPAIRRPIAATTLHHLETSAGSVVL